MTWKDLKLLVLQKVFAVSDGVVVEDDTTREYLTAMPGAANEGMALLATAGRPVKSKLVILPGDEERQGQDSATREKFDLLALAADFYSLDEDGVYVEEDGQYYPTADWSLEAGHIFVTPMGATGVWTIWYNAYPAMVTAETAEDFVIPLPQEAAVLLVLYIASQVYKDDDIAMAVQYRNEFEVGRAALVDAARRRNSGRSPWRNTKGWWDF